MSAVLAIASLRRIKATHRRRRKVTADHFVQRYYDPQIGRFLSTDPVTTNFNRYNYANNNPYRYIDPDGRNWISPCGIDCGRNPYENGSQEDRSRWEQSHRPIWNPRTVRNNTNHHTAEDEQAMDNINQTLSDYGLAVWASGDVEGINDYESALLAYDPEQLLALFPGRRVAAGGVEVQNVILFSSIGYGYARSSIGPGALNYSGTRLPAGTTWGAIQEFSTAHEFGHLHSRYGNADPRVPNIEGRANAYVKSIWNFIGPYIDAVPDWGN